MCRLAEKTTVFTDKSVSGLFLDRYDACRASQNAQVYPSTCRRRVPTMDRR
ncbi:hypothetical protein C4K24_1566 [Pseudomonas chlororaphis subsp. aurantiaca]|nr:hypothetical protein C4K24_1566 [Pseudomonas chlororaphis subsp. aurantiaca]